MHFSAICIVASRFSTVPLNSFHLWELIYSTSKLHYLTVECELSNFANWTDAWYQSMAINHTLILTFVLSFLFSFFLSRLLIRWGQHTWLTLHVTLCCNGNTLFSHIPDHLISVLCHSLVPGNSRPISLLSPITAIALAIAILWCRSVLGRPSACWPVLHGGRWWGCCCATGWDS